LPFSQLMTKKVRFSFT